VRPFWSAVHLIGFVAWMGGILAALIVVRAARREPRGIQAVGARLGASLHRGLVGPGAMLTVLSGLLLTLGMYGGATSVGGLPRPLIVMELAGILGAAVALVVLLPTATRLARIDPLGEYAAAFDRLRANLSRWSLASALLAAVALLAAAML
jgi:hypothetical protein